MTNDFKNSDYEQNSKLFGLFFLVVTSQENNLAVQKSSIFLPACSAFGGFGGQANFRNI